MRRSPLPEARRSITTRPGTRSSGTWWCFSPTGPASSSGGARLTFPSGRDATTRASATSGPSARFRRRRVPATARSRSRTRSSVTGAWRSSSRPRPGPTSAGTTSRAIWITGSGGILPRKTTASIRTGSARGSLRSPPFRRRNTSSTSSSSSPRKRPFPGTCFPPISWISSGASAGRSRSAFPGPGNNRPRGSGCPSIASGSTSTIAWRPFSSARGAPVRSLPVDSAPSTSAAPRSRPPTGVITGRSAAASAPCGNSSAIRSPSRRRTIPSARPGASGPRRFAARCSGRATPWGKPRP